jgi:hypothetical protein
LPSTRILPKLVFLTRSVVVGRRARDFWAGSVAAALAAVVVVSAAELSPE